MTDDGPASTATMIVPRLCLWGLPANMWILSLREVRRRLFYAIAFLLQPCVFFPQTRELLLEMFVIDLLLLTRSPVLCPDPGMQRLFMHPEVARCLCNGLIRLDHQCDGALLACRGIFSRRRLTHRTHL